MVAALLGDGAAARLVGRSEYCDWPEALVRDLPVVSRSAVDLSGKSGEEVDAALKQARKDGATSAHALDLAWLRDARPGLVLTQETCPVCDAAAGSVHAALDAAGLGRERALTLSPTSVDSVLAAMRTLGAALGEL